MKIVSIVGKKNTGKTSLTVKVIEELTKRGYNVASIKHSHHTMEMDKENTDTWKHKQAGSNLVVGIGSTTFFNVRKEMDLNRLLFLIKIMDDIDFVVIEGFKKYNYPKIATSPEVVDEYTIKEVNSFEITPEGVSELADLIEERGHDIVDTLFVHNCGFNNGESISKEIREGRLKTEDLDEIVGYMSIDEKVVGLNRFVSEYIKQNILGIINTLNITDYGVENVNKIELLINNEDNLSPSKSSCNISINKTHLNINKFVSDIVTNSVTGMVKSLKINEPIENIDVNIRNIKDNDVVNADISIKLNGNYLEINQFVRGILKESIFAIIKTLKIDEEIKEIEINVVD